MNDLIHFSGADRVQRGGPPVHAAAPPGFPFDSSTNTEVPRTLFVLSFLYLLVPSVIVLLRFQAWSTAIPVALAAVAAVWWLAVCWRVAPVPAPSWRWSASWPFLMLAAVAAWTIGVIPPFAQNEDWIKHYALFNILSDQSWPPAVATEQGIGTLRYSLGYYVVPSLIAKLTGPASLGLAIYAWTMLGLYLSLTLAFAAKAVPVAGRFLLGAVFLLFSGADVVGRGIVHSKLVLPMHYEWWAGFGEFSSSITSIVWTPQHALSAWIATFLIVRYPQRTVQGAGVLGAAVAIWSPFSAVGIAPVLAWAVYKAGLRHLLTWMNLIAAPVLLFAGAMFLTRDAGGIPTGFVWNHIDFTGNHIVFSTARWLLFVALEFVLIALSLLVVTPRRAGLIAIATITLLLLSLTDVGVSSDLMMRGSLPALGILAALAAVAVVTAPNTWRKAPLVACLLLGVVTPMGEIMRGLNRDRFEDPHKFLLTDVIFGDGARLAPQYVVRGFNGPIVRTSVAAMETMHFSPFGDAVFDQARHRVSAIGLVDAAMVSSAMTLPVGLYEIDAVADWDLRSGPGDKHAGHISVHGMRIVVSIPESHAADKKLQGYFWSDGKPMAISFGLGGWGSASGFIELKQLRINHVAFP